MVKHSFFSLPVSRPDSAALILASGFLLGHLLGVWSSGSAGEHLVSTMRLAASSHVSIISSLSSAVLPFLFSAFAVYLGRPALLIPIAFGKAFFFSYVGYGLLTAWGSAGWLVAGLMQFGSACSMPVLCWYWLRHIGGRAFRGSEFCLILFCLLVVGTVDYYLIAPFLAGIITF